MAEFVGSYQHTLDAKGRLILPSKFREDFATGGYLSPQEDHSIALWTPTEFAKRRREMQSDRATREGRTIARTWSAMTFVAEFDKQGRFAIPVTLRDHAGLTSDVMVIGEIDHLSLWSPATFDRLIADGLEILEKGHA